MPVLTKRCISAIYLRTLDTKQGGYEVLNLQTGKMVTRHYVKELHINKEVIARVEQLVG